MNNTSKWQRGEKNILSGSDSARGAVILATSVVGEVNSLKLKTNV